MELLPVIVPPGREAVDVGANIGLYSLALSSLAKHVHAFEPIPEVAAFIGRVLPKNVSVHNIAVSDVVGEIDLYVPVHKGRAISGYATVEKPKASSSDKCYRVSTTTLNTLIAHDIGFVKIDVEGHELAILKGAQELVEQWRPTILIEAEARHRAGAVNDTFSFFKYNNYCGFFILKDEVLSTDNFEPSMQNIVLLENDGPRRQNIYVNNFIFIPKERCSDKIVRSMQRALQPLTRRP